MKSYTSGEACSGTRLSIENLQFYKTIVDGMTSAMFIFQGKQMCYVNASAQSISGYSQEELLAMPFWAIIHEDFREQVKQRGLSRQSGNDTPANYELKIVRKDGDIRWVNFRASMIELDGKLAVLGFAEDISERKQVENNLLQARNAYERLASYNEATAKFSVDEIIQKTLEFLHDDTTVRLSIDQHQLS